MKLFNLFALAGLLLATASSAIASEYKDFLRDLATPYGHYRQSLMLTNSKDNTDKARLAIDQFIRGWEGLATRYAMDPPAPFAGMADFSARMKRVTAIAQEAQTLMKDGQAARAHAVLEEVRYLLWDMRIKARINSVADKANDFHEAMEVVLDQAAAAKSKEDLTNIWNRYAAWLLIKWEDHAMADDLGPMRKQFDSALLDGRNSINAYLDALRNGDADMVKKLAGGVKNAYKKIWALDPE